MRVALLSANAQAENAIGNQVAEKAAFFRERGAAVRLFLEDTRRLHPELKPVAEPLAEATASGSAWNYLRDCDLVIADYAQHYELLHFLPLLVEQKPRLVLDYHGVTPARFWHGPQRELAERSERLRGIVWCTDWALAHSEFAKKVLQQATGYPAERIQVMPYPTDTTLFRPTESQTQKANPDPVLLYVGRLAASKRVSLLIEALPHLPGGQAWIVGDTNDVYAEEAVRCRALAERLGVADRVRFLGQVPERQLAEFYRSADALIIPSMHEGYCLPAIEAMACGLPVIAARTSALPETLGDAGLTFEPDNVEDLVEIVDRTLRVRNSTRAASRPNRIAIVSFRFGKSIVGGAERSLRTMALALKAAGNQVEIFTTCTNHESAWTNTLPAGTFAEDSLTIHRFPIDVHDRTAHHASIRRILEANGDFDATAETEYLRHSIHSAALLQALKNRNGEFDVILVGPYLFGLTHDIANDFPDKTLLVPCFHDEPFARLRTWQSAYTAVGGVLYHSPEEQSFAENELGLNHPRARQIGTWVDVADVATPRIAMRGLTTGPYVVYCGRYSAQKNLPLLLEWAERYEGERPGRFRFVFAGEGEVEIPGAAWAHDRGRVTEEDKRSLLAHAAALVQLSTQESLSLVALEAWAESTPVIVSAGCRVLAGQVERSGGGRAVADYAEFARVLDELREKPDNWRRMGRQGRAYVETTHGSEEAYRRRLLAAVKSLSIPLGDMMRERGLARAAERSRPRWRERFDTFVEQVLDAAPENRKFDVVVEPQTSSCGAAAGRRSQLIPVQVHNRGALPALADGPSKTALVAEVLDAATGKPAAPVSRGALPGMLNPGQSLPAAVLVTLPERAGEYQIAVSVESSQPGFSAAAPRLVPLTIAMEAFSNSATNAAFSLETIHAALAEAHRLERLPDDYLDVTQGRFARWKRWLKAKLLGNFKKAYIDVLSHQQSQVNGQLLLAVRQLADYCATLEHAVATLNERLERSQPATPSENVPESTEVIDPGELALGHPWRETT